MNKVDDVESQQHNNVQQQHVLGKHVVSDVNVVIIGTFFQLTHEAGK